MAANSPMPTRNMGTLGTLFLVARKTNQDVQSFPIDCSRVTIGRDFDCDIRLYFSDVSKLHCEITFDLLTDQAALHVHGGNGIKFTPKGGKTTDEKPPAVLALSSGDSFVLRKKLFRFEYGAADGVATYSTPSKGPATPLASPARSVRRRASHRLSLVPDGKVFEPQTPASKNRRKSVGPSKLSQHQEDPEQSVDVVEAEEGYKVYMEQTQVEEEEIEAVEEDVGCVRTTAPSAVSNNQDAAEQVAYEAPSTPSKPTRVNAQIALTTPRGSGSLRKSLLLKSARKAWKETQSPGVEGAIENGNVQIRRRSLSPKVASPALLEESASPEEEEGGHEDEHAAMAAERKDDAEPQEFQWVAEEGLDASMNESESDASFEANESLEIPGQSVMTFTPPPKIRIEHESMQEGPETWQDAESETADVAVNVDAVEGDQEDIHGEEYLLEAKEDDVASEDDEASEDDAKAEEENRPFNQFFTPQQKRSLGPPQRVVASVGPSVRFATASFAARPSLGPPSRGRREVPVVESPNPELKEIKPSLFMTPSRDAERAEAKRRRQSLATPRGLPAPPASFRNVTRETPRRLFATPSHPALKRSTPEAALLTKEPPATPLDDIKRRLSLLQRQSATAPARRAIVSFGMPSTPSARAAPIASISHTVVTKRPAGSGFLFNRPRPQATLDEEEEEEQEDGMSMDEATPSRPRNDRQLATPTTPVVQPIPGSAVSSLFVSPDPIVTVMPTVALRDVLPPPDDMTSTSSVSAASSKNLSSSSPSYTPAQQPSTPDFSAIRKMVYAPLPPKTPNFAGIKQMYPELPAPAKTPDFTGLRHMYPAHAPRTPRYAGMREMLADPVQQASSPDLGGVGEMFAADEDIENGGTADVTNHGSSAYATKETTPATSRSRRKAASESKAPEMGEVGPSGSTKTRSIVKPNTGRTRKAAETPAAIEAEVKSASRSRRAPTEDAAADGPSTRTRRAATAEQVEQDPPSKASTSRSRPTKRTEPVVPANDAPSKPTRASRTAGKKPVLGEASEQPTTEDDAPSKSSKRKATAAPAPIAAESASAPARRTRAKLDKENEPEVAAGNAATVVKKAPARRAETNKTVEVAATPVSAPSTRSTRSTRSRN